MNIEEGTFGILPQKLHRYFAQYCLATVQIPYDSNSIGSFLPKILKAVKNSIKQPDVQRKVDILRNIGTSIQVEQGQLLVSLFCDSYCQRDSQIQTRIVEDIFAPESTESPQYADYNYDFLGQEPSQSLINGNGIKSECTFYREHKARSHEPFVPCETCHGSGRIKCTACGGSGREKYVDGYFASGEERIKTGPCSECHGSGSVPCSECHGQGKIEIFAPNYSVEKYVDEVIKQVPSIAYSSPWMDNFTTYGNSHRYMIYKQIETDIQHAVWGEEYVSLKMKNCKEKAKDTTQEIEEQFDQIGLRDIYKKNQERIKIKRNFICRQERHYVIPITRLCITFRRLFKQSDVSYDFYIIPDDVDTCKVLVTKRMIGVGKFEYLITKLFRKSHL